MLVYFRKIDINSTDSSQTSHQTLPNALLFSDFPAPAAAPEAVPQKAAEPVVEKEIIGE
jgi:hypothetical protein